MIYHETPPIYPYEHYCETQVGFIKDVDTALMVILAFSAGIHFLEPRDKIKLLEPWEVFRWRIEHGI